MLMFSVNTTNYFECYVHSIDKLSQQINTSRELAAITNYRQQSVVCSVLNQANISLWAIPIRMSPSQHYSPRLPIKHGCFKVWIEKNYRGRVWFVEGQWTGFMDFLQHCKRLFATLYLIWTEPAHCRFTKMQENA